MWLFRLVYEALPNHTLRRIGSVEDVNKGWKRTTRSEYPPLVVRVLCRSRIRYYGKPAKQERWPYQVHTSIK